MSDIAFKINGGKPLSGHIQAQRSKNAILPMIATALIPKEGQTVLHGVPDIADVRRALELATLVGAEVEHRVTIPLPYVCKIFCTCLNAT